MAAEAAISTLIQLLGDQVIEKVKFLRGVEGKVWLLEDELQRMRSFLNDANRKQFEDERVRHWISEIREVAQDAQDTIELFLLNADNSSGPLKCCTSFLKCTNHLNSIGEDIELILERLKAIDNSRKTYGIQDLGEAAEATRILRAQSKRRLDPWQKDEDLVGIEDDVEKLLRESILNEEKKGLSVAVLQGMGGIGKSTIAREIYNHSKVIVSDRFDCRGWVVVSSEFTPQETIKQIILELPGSDRGKIRELEESTKDKLYLQRKLKEMLLQQLEGKSYFIVLDDIWKKKHLESLITAFPNQQDKTSRLLVTTRNKKIIGTNYDHYLHEMTGLDLEKSWELLLKKAFSDSTNAQCPEELESIGRQILEKCDGLPLAISVVGGLLLETQSVSGWNKVLNHLHSHFVKDGVSTILELSYQNLSPQLKACFLLLSFFKEDSNISAKKLVNIWVGHGLIQDEESRRIEEIGRDYINDLINRSMLQIEYSTIDDRVKYCRLHDLVRDMCIRKAKEEIGLQIVRDEIKEEDEKGSSFKSLYKPRHRVVYSMKNLEASSLNQNKHIRSLFLFNHDADLDVYKCIPSGYWKSFQLLKMLDIEWIGSPKLPNALRLLIGLKNLRLGCFMGVEIPRWLDQLINLEVLDVEAPIEFPNAALKMKKLRHWHVVGMYGRVMKIKEWEKIESLKGIRLEDWLECSSSLVASSHLRELGIRLDKSPTADDLKRLGVSLGKMENLVKLQLKFIFSDPIKGIDFNGLLPNGLTELNLMIRNVSNYPTASQLPPNLTHLKLNSRDGDNAMEELCKLPKLRYLTLTSRDQSVKVLHDCFPAWKPSASSSWSVSAVSTSKKVECRASNVSKSITAHI